MFQLLLGHLAGDYLFQTPFMAQNKAKNTLIGWFAAFIHCLIYTCSVCLFMWNFDLIWIVAVFLSHFPIDKFSLGEIYCDKIKNYSLKKFINKNIVINNPNEINIPMPRPDPIPTNMDIVDGGFRVFVYAVTDNTMHLVLMYLAYIIIY